MRRKGKDIYITTLDLTNAFGSVSHKMIVDTMKQLGMPEFLIEFVRDTYRDNGTKIITSRGETRRIRIRRGVRQGCPLSPTLFNLCLEPLFKALDTVNKNEGITVETEDQEGRCSYTINAQAYADHLVLISNTRTEMMDLLNTVEMFCKFAGLKMAVQKCKTISYIKEGNRRVSDPVPFTIDGEEIPTEDVTEAMEYLGTVISVSQRLKMSDARKVLEDLKTKIWRVGRTKTRLVQKFDLIRRFIVPQLDFILLNSVVSIRDLKRFDKFIRTQIRQWVGGPTLPKAMIYAHWKDGGLNIPSLRDRYQALQISAWGKAMIGTRDRDNLMKALFEEEIQFRDIQREDEDRVTFLDWKFRGGKIVQKNERNSRSHMCQT